MPSGGAHYQWVGDWRRRSRSTPAGPCHRSLSIDRFDSAALPDSELDNMVSSELDTTWVLAPDDLAAALNRSHPRPSGDVCPAAITNTCPGGIAHSPSGWHCAQPVDSTDGDAPPLIRGRSASNTKVPRCNPAAYTPGSSPRSRTGGWPPRRRRAVRSRSRVSRLRPLDRLPARIAHRKRASTTWYCGAWRCCWLCCQCAFAESHFPSRQRSSQSTPVSVLQASRAARRGD